MEIKNKINKKNMFAVGIILIMSIVLLLVFNLPGQETITEDSVLTYQKKLEASYTPTEWIVQDNSIYTITNIAKINITPHTSNRPIIEIEDYGYTGEIDVIFGFPTNEIIPKKLELSQGIQNVSKSFTCNFDFNYTTNPNEFYCFRTAKNLEDNSDVYELVKHGLFDSGNIALKTVYWEEEQEVWNDISGTFNLKEFSFEGINKWWIRSNVAIQSGDNYRLRLTIQPTSMNIPTQKWWFALKPSHENLTQSIENEHFYALDPWTTELEDNNTVYYNFEESANPVIDLSGNANSTGFGIAREVTGRVNFGYQFTTGDVVTADSKRHLFNFGTSPVTFSHWIKMDSDVSGYSVRKSLGGFGYYVAYLSGGTVQFLLSSSSSSSSVTSTDTCSVGSWCHIVAQRLTNGTMRIYIDGSLQSADAVMSGTLNSTVEATIGNDAGNVTTVIGTIDEVAFWRKALTSTDIANLYNSGNGITKDLGGPTVNIVFPVNGTTYSTSVTQMNYTVDTASLCWSSTDKGITNSTPVTAGVNFTISAVPEWNNWTAYCNSSAGAIGFDEVTFFVNKSVGTTLISPENNFESQIIDPLLFSYNSTSLNTNLTNTTFFLWFKNGTFIQSNFTSLSGMDTVNTQINVTNLIDEEYLWTAETCGDSVSCSLASNRSFEIHNVTPKINLTAPQGQIPSFLLGNNLTLNWTVSETGENLTDHITNCSYTYNNSVTLITPSDCTSVNTTSFEYILGQNSLTFNVTDKFNLTNSSTTTWTFKVLEINQTFNAETTEGGLETFLANIRLGSGLSISEAVIFNYNGTIEAGQSFINGDDTTLKKEDFIIPNVDTDLNFSFHWELTLSDSTEINLSIQNQTVLALGIDNCSNFTNEILNFTVIDEETQIILPNATIEIAVNIYDRKRQSVILEQSALTNGTNPVSVCLNTVIPTGLFYSMDSITRYEDSQHANEYYNIVNSTLTNGTESQLITLYDLNLSDSTEFQLSFTGSDFLPVENALVSVDRQYISENVFKTVELPKTDFNGQAVLHLVRNDVIYNIRVVKDGVLLGNFENIVAFCDDFTIGDCNIDLNAFDSVESIFNYNSELGIIFEEPEYNASNDKVSFDFVTSDGVARSVRLEVTRNDIFGNRSICNSTLLSSGGTLTCDVPSSIDETILRTEIFVNEELVSINSVKIDSTNFGVGGYLVMFVMALSFVFMFSSSKTGVLISLGVTLAGSISLGMVTGDLIGIGASGLWLLIIVALGIYKLNEDRNA